MATKKTDPDTRLLSSLGDLREIEEFLHHLLGDVSTRRLKPGTDLLPHAERMKLAVPAALRGLPIVWDGGVKIDDEDLGDDPPISIVRPGNPAALGFTIGCVRIGKRVKVCLECGWLYCKIVIKGRF